MDTWTVKTVDIDGQECFLERSGESWALFGGLDRKLWATGVLMDQISGGRRQKLIRGTRTKDCPLSAVELQCHVSLALGLNTSRNIGLLEVIRQAKTSGWWPE